MGDTGNSGETKPRYKHDKPADEAPLHFNGASKTTLGEGVRYIDDQNQRLPVKERLSDGGYAKKYARYSNRVAEFQVGLLRKAAGSNRSRPMWKLETARDSLRALIEENEKTLIKAKADLVDVEDKIIQQSAAEAALPDLLEPRLRALDAELDLASRAIAQAVDDVDEISTSLFLMNRNLVRDQ